MHVVTGMKLHLPATVPFVVHNIQGNTTNHYAHVHIGNEAAAYLQLIVEYYDCLPRHMAFIHAQQMDAETSKVTCASTDRLQLHHSSIFLLY